MSGPVLFPDSIPDLMELNTEILREEVEVACWDLGNKERAMEAVAMAAAQLPLSAAQQVDNRRRRYQPKSEERPPYRPLMGQRELFRLLLLDVLDEFGAEDEAAGCLPTADSQIRSYVRQIVKPALNHKAFYAAVGMAHVLCDYSAQQTLDMYHLGTESRPNPKNWAACSRARGKFLNGFVEQFGKRVHLRKEGGVNQVDWRPPTAREVELVKRSLDVFVPPVSELPRTVPANGFLCRMLPFLEKSQTEMNLIQPFLDPRQFARLAARITGAKDAVAAFDAHIRVLDLPTPAGPDPGSRDPEDAVLTDSDLVHLRDLIRKYRYLTRRRAPGSICIRVDGVDRAVIDELHPACDVVLEEGASIVKVVIRGDAESFTLATHVLTYDSPGMERWSVDVPGRSNVSFTFEYGDDECVSASIRLGSEPVDSAYVIERHEVSEDAEVVGESLRSHVIDVSDRWLIIQDRYVTGEISTSSWFQCFSRMLSELRRNVFTFVCSEHQEREPNQQSVINLGALLRLGLDTQMPRELSKADKVTEIDRLFTRQAVVLDRFLTRARTHELELELIPSIYDPHESVGRWSGRIAVASILCDAAGLWFFGDLVKMGATAAGLSVTILGLAALIAAKSWWKFGWSGRLYREYYEAEHVISLLRADLNREAISESPRTRAATDWRDFPLARTLATLLAPGLPQHAVNVSGIAGTRSTSNTASWTVNSIREEDLVSIIRELGEERRARKIARAVVRARPIESMSDLVTVLGKTLELPDAIAKALEDCMNEISDHDRHSASNRDGDTSA